MKVFVSISIFCDSTSSFGSISGELLVPAVPTIGSRISFMSPAEGVDVVALRLFQGELSVISVTIIPGAPGQVICGLDDIVLKSEEEARVISEFFEEGYGLYFDPCIPD